MVRLGRPTRPLLAAAMALGCHTGCSVRQGTLEDHEEVCTLRCEKLFECHPDGIDHDSVEECIEECNTPNEGWWRTKECDEPAEIMMECIAGLSCEEHNKHYGGDLVNSPCYEETADISTCLVRHPKNP